MWGFIAAVNSTANQVTLSAANGFTTMTNVFSVTATSNTAAIYVAVTAANITTITLTANSTTNTGVYFTIIGK